MYRVQGYLYFIISVIFFSACDNENDPDLQVTYRLEKIDSFRVERDTRIRILDFNAVNKEYLAYDHIKEEILRLDDKGNVLEAVRRFGEGPHEYSTSLLAASFNHESGGYYLQSSNEFVWYNKDWEVKNRLKITPFHNIKFYTGPKLKVPYFHLQAKNEPYFFANFFTGVPVHNFDSKEDLSAKNLIELYNPVESTLEWVLPLDVSLLSKSDPNNGKLMINQIYALDPLSNLLYLSFQNGNRIGIYDITNKFELVKRIDFGHQEFSQTNKSKNKALLNFDNKEVGVLYYTGLSEGAEQIKKEQNPHYFSFQDPNLYKIIMLRDGEWLKSTEIQFPLGSEPHSEILQLPNNRVLLRDMDPVDVEPEFSNYSIYELKSMSK